MGTFQRTLLLGRRYNREKKAKEANLIQNKPKDQNDPSEGSTADKLAQQGTATQQNKQIKVILLFLPPTNLPSSTAHARAGSPLTSGHFVRKLKYRPRARGITLPKGVDQNDPPVSTAEKLAQQHGVSPATVKRAGQYAAAIDAVTKAMPDVAPASAPRQAVIKAAAMIEKAPERAAEIIFVPNWAHFNARCCWGVGITGKRKSRGGERIVSLGRQKLPAQTLRKN